VGAAVAAIVSYAMTAYVADVAVYTNMDATSKNFAARNAILDGSTAALKALLSCGQYDRVILAGHSLGSVIAYDTINEILAQSNAGPGPADDRPSTVLSDAQIGLLKGLVTFGCPLDKINYFFREHVKRDQAIRAQVLSMLHSFRKVSSGRDYGEFTFNYKFAQLDDLIWMNAWARMDFVSGRLQFYDVNDRKQFHYVVPALAHLRYWSDPEFYEYFCGRLLVGPAAPPSPPPPGAASPAIREPQPLAR
jgi:pimeloyl-ACP methyl ester carboxylesterase